MHSKTKLGALDLLGGFCVISTLTLTAIVSSTACSSDKGSHSPENDGSDTSGAGGQSTAGGSGAEPNGGSSGNAGEGGVGNQDPIGGAASGGNADAGGEGGQDAVDPEVPGSGHLRVIQIAGGYGFTCALTKGGAVKCWGESVLGTLGDGKPLYDGAQSLSAVDVVGLASGVKRIAAAGWNVCAIKSDDHVVCWGGDLYGELNAAPARGSSTPVPVGGFAGTAVDISLAYDVNGLTDHGCLVDSSFKVWCWGSNATKQLGVDAIAKSATVVSSQELTGFSLVTAGGGSSGAALTCALTPGGAVKCWGTNGAGRLGIGAEDTMLQLITASPMEPIGLGSGVTQIASTGRGGTCVLTTAGGVKCWGEGTLNQLGYSVAGVGYSATPREVEGLAPGVVQIAAGYAHFCALLEDATMKCWGYNQNGQLGDQPAALTVNLSSMTPLVVKDVTDVAVIGVGYNQSCAGLKAGGVVCWGSGRPSGSPLGTEIHPVLVEGI